MGSAWAQAAASVPTIAKSAVTLDDKSRTETTATEYHALHFLLHIMNNILMEQKLSIAHHEDVKNVTLSGLSYKQ